MYSQKPILLLLALAGLVIAPMAFSFNTAFLRDAPISAMTDAEFDTMVETFHRALDEAAENETVEWGSADTAHGTVTPTTRFSHSGAECRRVEYQSFAGGSKGGGELRFCKNPEGEWKILSGVE